MLILQGNPNVAVIEFTVVKFVSVTKGKMMLTLDPPKDVVSSLSVNTTPPRVAMRNNNEFEFSVGGGPALDLVFTVSPSDKYAAVGLFVQKVSADSDGGGVWDKVTVGNGPFDNTVYVRNKGKSDAAPPSTYRVFMLIRQRDAGEDYALGDIGVIDPLWINR